MEYACKHDDNIERDSLNSSRAKRDVTKLTTPKGKHLLNLDGEISCDIYSIPKIKTWKQIRVINETTSCKVVKEERIIS